MLEREVVYKPGATFFEQGGVTYFKYQPDASTVIGPRKATNADKAKYAIEWAIFNDGRLPQLDHDGDGIPGGSKPAPESERIAKVEEEAREAKSPIRPVSDEHKHAPANYETPKRRGRPRKGV